MRSGFADGPEACALPFAAPAGLGAAASDAPSLREVMRHRPDRVFTKPIALGTPAIANNIQLSQAIALEAARLALLDVDDALGVDFDLTESRHRDRVAGGIEHDQAVLDLDVAPDRRRLAWTGAGRWGTGARPEPAVT